MKNTHIYVLEVRVLARLKVLVRDVCGQRKRRIQQLYLFDQHLSLLGINLKNTFACDSRRAGTQLCNWDEADGA